MASEIRVQLLHLVLNNPEIKHVDIRAYPSFENYSALADLLYNCREDAQLVADEAGRYTITAKGHAYLKGAGVELRGRGELVIKMPSPGRRNGNAATRGIADKLLRQAQGALDEYVANVCDPEILGRFQAARDSARQLVNSLNGAGIDSEGADGG